MRSLHKRNILVAAAALAVSCAKYEPRPLDTDAVEQALRVPDRDRIRAASTELRHPILAPLDVDLTQGLSPESVAVLAVLLNPELRAERDRRALADAQLLQAGLLPNPQLAASVDFPQHADAADSFTAYGIGASWDITSLLTIRAKRDAASSERESVDLDVAWKEWQVAEAAKTAAYDVIALQGQLREAREADRQLAENLSLIRRATEQHEKTLLELSAAEASYQDAHAVVLAGEKDLSHARLVLNQSLGLPTDATVEVFQQPLPSRFEPPPVEHLLAGLDGRRLDLIALRRGYESQDSLLRAAILGQFPKINFGVNAARDTSNVKTIGIGGTIDIPIFDRNQGAIAVEKATRQKLFDEYVARTYAARSEVGMAIADIRSTNDQIAAAEAALPSFERLARSYRLALGRGDVDVLSAYGAEVTLMQKRLEVAKLKQQLISGWITLEIASGQYLPFKGSTATSTAPATTENSR